MNPIILPPAMGKIVGQTRFFSLGEATSLGEGKLWIQTCLTPLKKLTLCHILPERRGWVNMIKTAKKTCLCLRCHHWPPSLKLVFKVLFLQYIIDKPRSTCSSNFYQDALKELMECSPYKSTQELALDLSTYQSTICHHLKKIKWANWVFGFLILLVSVVSW